MIGWRNSLERTSDVAVRRDTVNGLGCANVPAESAHSALWPPRFFPSTGLLELQSALCIDIWPRSTADEKNINLQSHGSSRRHFVRSSTEFCDARCDTRVKQALLDCCSRGRWLSPSTCAFDCDVCPHRDPLDWLKTSRTFSHARLRITLALGAASLAALGIYLADPLASRSNLTTPHFCDPPGSEPGGKDPAVPTFSPRCGGKSDIRMCEQYLRRSPQK
jgi:hypothetical protein